MSENNQTGLLSLADKNLQKQWIRDQYQQQMAGILKPLPKTEYNQDEALKRIEEKCDSIIRKLDLIFGDHVLINCRLVKISELKIKVK
jgi:hypothetical protein